MIDDYAHFVDSGLTYDSTPATTISGLDHLEGETVTILADGAAHPTKVVSSGSITLDRLASIVTVGLGYDASVVTMPIEAGAAEGTAQGKKMRINNITIRLYETGPGLYYGSSLTNLNEYQMRGSNDLMDEPVPLLTGITELLAWPGEYETAAQMAIVHKLPLPFTLMALMPQLRTYDR